MARYVTVSSVSESAPASSPGQQAGLLDHAAHRIWQAKQHGSDLVAFPEIYPHWHHGPPAEAAEPIDCPAVARICEEAQRHRLHVVWPMYERDGDRIYNSSLLIDRDGEIIGVYHKMFPTIPEIEKGVVPGHDEPVFDTDFGRVGMAICFDLNFPELMEGLARNGAEVIVFSSAYRGGMQLQYWAFQLGVTIVASIATELGRIVDLTGRVLETSTYEALVSHRINLDRRLLHMDMNWNKMDAMLERYGTDVHFDYITQEACYAVSSEREGLSIDEIIAEFGLEERAAYFERSRAVRRQALEPPGLVRASPPI